MRHQRFAPNFRTSSAGKRSRSGFTLIELMVAMALSLFLMTILSEAFAVSMDTFRGLRAIGDMQDTLRNGLRQMREDLASPHFEGGRKISDVGFWMEPRREGFFYMRGTAIPNPGSGTIGATANVAFNEGNDGYGIMSSRAVDHVLHFAVRRSGLRPTNFFMVGPYNAPSAPTPPLAHITALNYTADAYYEQVYNYPPSATATPSNPSPKTYANVMSQWAEVAYMLLPMAGNATVPEAQGTSARVPLYNLYRAQAVVLPYTNAVTVSSITQPSTTLVDGTPGSATLPQFSNGVLNNTPVFFSPNDLAMSNRGMNPAVPNAAQLSLVCTNVISFQVRLLMQQRVPVAGATPLVPMQTTVTLDDIQNRILPATGTIDTATTTVPAWADPSLGNPYRIMGVQIRLRIYDPASGQVRQNTLVQAL